MKNHRNQDFKRPCFFSRFEVGFFRKINMSDLQNIIGKKGLVKVPKPEDDSKYRKVAKFLFLIGPKQAAEVLKQLDDVQVEKVIAELVTIRSIDKSEALDILTEFNAIYEEYKNSVGGTGVAKEILQEVYGDEKADEILKRTIPPKPIKPFTYLKDVDAAELATVLEGELPSAVAIIISFLPAKQAANYISSVTDKTRKKDIIVHLAKMQKVSDNVLQAISDALRKKLVNLSLDKTSKLDGKSVLAKILRNSNIETEKNILQNLSNENENLVQDIIKQIYTIDDILQMSDKDVQHLLSKLQDFEIRILIYNRDQKLRQKILTNISRNKALFILDDEKSFDAPSPKDCLDIEKKFVRLLIQESQKNNVIVPKDESDKLIY